MICISIIVFICRIDQGFFCINEFIELLTVGGIFILNITIRICACCIYTGRLIGTSKQVNQVGRDIVKGLPYICFENISEVGAVNMLIILNVSPPPPHTHIHMKVLTFVDTGIVSHLQQFSS
jgi:hypothetical protein